MEEPILLKPNIETWDILAPERREILLLAETKSRIENLLPNLAPRLTETELPRQAESSTERWPADRQWLRKDMDDPSMHECTTESPDTDPVTASPRTDKALPTRT